ncbi:uncharacterized protein [Triticum aestivum]|nr:uncharacterized protein LOC123149245 [Triticum aestivum]XP_044424795.1 uncharacterized protein LOC123149245 [Triticum aestivum]XP_044424796.1 uncharacterized protein LOC123149245 [Triticum aestivum]XP_044424797.1 uncharacterized protein LOC123149245 [Triticum aestivum]XP_044424798.1 uncharacterized protein LOC123149245 [Triticum aestivum]XP_044424799.1 uncharacterized protein LOC123149245 [Triticum aestivum]XP_044424800.1 uncharacterized protein LOC123149245 [Triticum aestivum]
MAPPQPPLASIPIPDDLLEEIFLRLPTPDALARASAACTSFRRVIKGRAFRRRFRGLHRPPLLGFMDAAGFHHAQAPHPSAPLAGALAPRAADFSFVPAVVSSCSYYVPPGVQDDGEGPRWRPRDVRGGRVLLDWISLHPRTVRICCYHEDDAEVSILMDVNELTPRDRPTWTERERCNAADFHLAVCDPLSSRYVLLPTIPEDLAAQPQDSLWEFEPVLASNTSENGEEEPFKVICIAKYQTKLVLFVFPSTTMQWCMVESPVLPSLDQMSCFDCVRGRFYWTEPYTWSDHLMVLDTCTMRFSTVDLLTGYHQELRDLHHQNSYRGRPNSVVTGREGTLEMFSLVRENGYFALYHTSLQNNSQEWKLEKVISLPGQYHDYSISTVGAAEGFLFFQGAPKGIRIENVDCYSMEVKTYEITKVCTRMEQFLNRKRALPCFSFPPLLLEPTI